MRKSFVMLLAGSVVAATVALSGCGGSSSGSGAAAVSTVSGTASKGEAYVGTVNLKDYRGILRTTTSTPAGYYSFDVSSLTPPFFINAVGVDLYSIAIAVGRTNINPFTDVVARSAVAAAGSTPMSTVFSNLSSNRNLINGITSALPTARASFNTQMQNTGLYSKYAMASAPDFLNGAITIDQGVDLLFRDIKVEVSGNNLNITNASGGTLVSGSFSGTSFGTFTYNSTNINGLPGVTVTVTPATTCGAGYFGTTITTSTWGPCSKPITLCVATSGIDVGGWYYLINGHNVVLQNYQNPSEAEALAFTNAYLAACQ